MAKKIIESLMKKSCPLYKKCVWVRMGHAVIVGRIIISELHLFGTACVQPKTISQCPSLGLRHSCKTQPHVGPEQDSITGLKGLRG
jgi:hypothetical protein